MSYKKANEILTIVMNQAWGYTKYDAIKLDLLAERMP